MNPRYFSPSQKQALYLASDGRCARCGKDLGEDWEADHIEPHSHSGETDVVNGQALCAKCNREKAATTGHRLRTWQERAFDAYVAKSARDFLVVATPGAGKTRLAGEIVRNNLLASEVGRILVVVPTERLKFQWADDLARLGVELDPRWENAHGVLPSEMHGVVLTYQQVQSNPDLLRKHTSARRTFVVLDEIHHCGNNKSWGDALRQAFDPAIRRLSLSGTPFRTDNYEIPYVTYHDGVGQADFNYGYAEALLDGVCRPVYFPRRGPRSHRSNSKRWLIWCVPGLKRVAFLMADDPLITADIVVTRLSHSLREGAAGLQHAPALLRKVLREDSWRERIIQQTGESVEFETFRAFVETPPLEGLGVEVDLVKRLVRDDEEAERLLREALKEKPGPKRSRNNITESRTGTDRSYTLDRLARERPDLYEQVERGDVSPHRAAIQAGFRRPTATVYVDTPEAAIHGLRKRFSHSDLRKAIEADA